MKTIRLLSLLLITPLFFQGQSLTGLWTGSLSNDSVTIRNDQAFEIALTEYKGKVYGYSRNSFIVNDTFYYVLKRVKGTIEGDICEIKDDEIVSYNFPGKLDKGVRVTITFKKNLQDSTWHLSGDWKTNKTKKFYAISGKVEMKAEPDFSKSKIFPHLEELSMDKDVEFYAASKKPVATNESKDNKSNTAVQNKMPEPLKSNEPVIAKQNNTRPEQHNPAVESNDDAINKQEPMTKGGDKPEEAESFSSLKKSALPASSVPGTARKDVTNNLLKPQAKNTDIAIKREEPVMGEENGQPEGQLRKSGEITTVRKQEEKVLTAEPTVAPIIKAPTAAAFVKERKMVPPQVVTFKSDSLELALYDNGEIDGDTVSILLNGEMLMAKQGLKASAIKKTVYIQPGTDEVTLILYAENLGKYPPNTGLLVVKDGDEKYQVRFSADLQQNAAVVFRRRK